MNAPVWRDSAVHRGWAVDQAASLLRFFTASVDESGRFHELDDDGRPSPDGALPVLPPRQRLLTVTRVIHCYAASEQLGIPGGAAIVEAGLRTLWERHRDPARGGYREAVGERDEDAETTRTAYGHAHVLLAASGALAAGHERARALFDDVLAVIDEHFWSEPEGACRETFDEQWRSLEDYRGANSNMHLCEALLAAAQADGRDDLAQRAERIATKLIDGHARAGGWLLPEHFDAEWTPRLDYNRARLNDPFRPYGATIGHLMEWARLVLGAGLAVGSEDGWHLEAAEALFARAIDAGWDTRRGGLRYTVGWDAAPANPDRYWWPVAEGIAAASYLARLTGRPIYEVWYRRFWEFAADHLIDHARGGWYPQLDSDNRPTVDPWFGKPDIYHTLQATLLPILPVAPSLIGAIRANDLGAGSP